MSRYDTAYIVGIIEKSTGKLAGVSVFSEETPTLGTKFFPFTILVGKGENYSEGLADLRKQLEDQLWAWVKNLINERGWGSLYGERKT